MPPSSSPTHSQVLETASLVLMLLRRYKGDPVLPVHVAPTLLVALPGACLLLLRLLLPAPHGTRLLASYRPLRYVLYVVAKLSLAAAVAREQQQQHVASFGVLRGLGHALMEGVLLPLCCPVSGLRICALVVGYEAVRQGLKVHALEGVLLPLCYLVSAWCTIARLVPRRGLRLEAGVPLVAAVELLWLIGTAAAAVTAARCCLMLPR